MSAGVVAVLGAGGPTGRKCVEKLLADGKDVRAVVRDPSKYKNWPEQENLTVVQGDVTDEESLRSAIDGAKGVIFAVSGKTYFSPTKVDKEGVRKVSNVAKHSSSHVVLVSSALVTPKNRFNPIRILLNNIRWSLMDAKFAGENILRDSGVLYTVVRPGRLTDGPSCVNKLEAAQGDVASKLSGKAVSRADVAAICVAALQNPKAKNVTFELVSDKNIPASSNDIESIFDNLKSDIST